MRTVAGAEVPSILPCIGNGDAPQMSAHSDKDEPLRRLHPLVVMLWVSKKGQVDVLHTVYFFLGPMSHEEGLSLPLENGVLSFRNGIEVDFYRCQCQDVGRGRHAGEKVGDGILSYVGRDHTPSTKDDVRGQATWNFSLIFVWVFDVHFGIRVSVLVKAGYFEVCVRTAGRDKSWI